MAADTEGEAANVIGRKMASPRWTNRQRTLVMCSRGVSYRARHLMDDLRALMPHSKKDAKMDRKDKIGEVMPEICELKNCNNVVYFEGRKKAVRALILDGFEGRVQTIVGVLVKCLG